MSKQKMQMNARGLMVCPQCGDCTHWDVHVNDIEIPGYNKTGRIAVAIILFVILLFAFIPLCWVPLLLLIKSRKKTRIETQRRMVCNNCGYVHTERVGKVRKF
jgi:rubredoxin